MTLFADNCGWLLEADSVKQLCESLERAQIKVVEWVKWNPFAFDNLNDEMNTPILQRKADLRKRLAESQKTVRGHIMKFNIEATQWLGIYIDLDLQFRVHKNI